MEQKSAKNITGYMIMMFTMIWAILTPMTDWAVRFSEDPTRCHTLGGVELAENHLRKPEFTSFDDVHGLYEVGIKLPTDALSKLSPITLFKELFQTEGEQALKFPKPKVNQAEQSAWMTDEEFVREMLAGVNPTVIMASGKFTSKSKLDRQLYGDNTSTITREHLEPNLGGLSVEKAMENRKLFHLDHHDTIFPYLRRINETDTKAYAARTILFLQDNGTLKPLAIELSRPHPEGDKFGPVSNLNLPFGYLPRLMWLHTHAVVEPFIIATNRHLSVVHPIHKLLLPHYRDTMNINAVARNVLVNAEGIIESTFLGGKHALEMSAVAYKDWDFLWSSLPNDLVKRGRADADPSSLHGVVRLLIEDYPYAADGLEIWSAIHSWVEEYVSFYYKSDVAIAQDTELQAFWKEVREVGHADQKINARHASDELYLGQRDSEFWTCDAQPLEAFKRFGKKLAEIEQKLIQRNNDETLKMSYTLLYPSSEEGLTCRGIPNSISI
ncbi:Linoleate 9S-lipoxygenase [Glycine soja]|nr:Linoleate 9S-lipoxygenase [Glycine soja]